MMNHYYYMPQDMILCIVKANKQAHKKVVIALDNDLFAKFS